MIANAEANAVFTAAASANTAAANAAASANTAASASANTAAANAAANTAASAAASASANTAVSASANAPTTPAPGAGALATLVDSSLAKWDSSSGGGMSVPMPFENHVCLIEDTHVAGTTHIDDIDELASKLSEGQKLRFERQPDNMHDKWAIRVFAANDRIGYVPCTTNEILARLMDAGKCIGGKVTYCEKLGTWHKIHMEVYLDD